MSRLADNQRQRTGGADFLFRRRLNALPDRVDTKELQDELVKNNRTVLIWKEMNETSVPGS
jgi:hypothetical protein